MKVRLTNALAESHRAQRELLQSRGSSGSVSPVELEELVSALEKSTARTRQRIRTAKYEALLRLAEELLTEGATGNDDSRVAPQTIAEPESEQRRTEGDG
jgi:hypothetical protein